MGRRETGDEHIRKLTKVGSGSGSYAVTLPMRIVKNLGWQEKQKVVVTQEGKKIIIEDWKE